MEQATSRSYFFVRVPASTPFTPAGDKPRMFIPLSSLESLLEVYAKTNNSNSPFSQGSRFLFLTTLKSSQGRLSRRTLGGWGKVKNIPGPGAQVTASRLVCCASPGRRCLTSPWKPLRQHTTAFMLMPQVPVTFPRCKKHIKEAPACATQLPSPWRHQQH